MKNKIKFKIFSLIELILIFKWRVIIFLLIFPILILLAFFILLETKQNNLFFMAIFLLNYYVSVFILILLFAKVMSAYKARSPFFFIRRYNVTSYKGYWDEFKQPLRHLIGAEIGVYAGNNAESILNFLNIKQLVLVDPWKQYIDYKTGSSAMNRDQTSFDDLYLKVKSRFSNNSKIKIIRDKSINAAKMFDDEYFDFIYIDGDHSYEAVLADLLAWYPKLKKFGVMCGDDYGHISGHGVIKAVTEFAFKYKFLVSHGEDNQFWFVKT